MKNILNVLKFAASTAVLMLVAGCVSSTQKTAPGSDIPIELPAYSLESRFKLPSKHTRFDVLPDGRLVCLSGNTLLVETRKGSRSFAPRGTLDGFDTGDHGAGFIKVSPDGKRFAAGNWSDRIGIFTWNTMDAKWLYISHSEAAWADAGHLAVTQGKFGEQSRVSILKIGSFEPEIVEIVNHIGGASAGIAFDRDGNLYTGNGYKNTGPSTTGTVKYFPKDLWEKALTERIPISFETNGQVVIDILSASSLGFDDQGNLHVGGGDNFEEGVDIDFAAVVARQALKNSIDTRIPVDPADTGSILRLDPDKENAASRYDLDFNKATGELYLASEGRVYVYTINKSSSHSSSHDTAAPVEQVPAAAASVTTTKKDGVLRLMTYNVAGKFISDRRLDSVFDRIISFAAPDILVLQEFNASMADRLPDRLKRLLGGRWHVFGGMTSGIIQTMVASRYPLAMAIQDTIPPSDIRGVTAVLADLPNNVSRTDLYIMGIHFQCCDATEFRLRRQKAADAAIAWIRDAQTPGGRINLPWNTPIILTGDFNFTTDRVPDRTLITGNIIDNKNFGPDRRPDWDNTPLRDLAPQDPYTGDINSWPSSTQRPRTRYDRFYYTDSQLPHVTGFILNTLTMPGKNRADAGLEQDDTARASDHLPVIMEIPLP